MARYKPQESHRLLQKGGEMAALVPRNMQRRNGARGKRVYLQPR